MYVCRSSHANEWDYYRQLPRPTGRAYFGARFGFNMIEVDAIMPVAKHVMVIKTPKKIKRAKNVYNFLYSPYATGRVAGMQIFGRARQCMLALFFLGGF